MLVGVAALLAGCGGSARRGQPSPPPRLPRALAQTWSREANAIAGALAVNDGCAAEQRAGQLRTEVIAAINAGRVARPLLEPLTSAVNALPARITCTPPAPPPKPEKPPKHGHGHGHDKGDNQGGGDG
ncbi:MAG TPA: hypothetical protein VGH82_12270 [Gaiellaceae bacterium]